MRCYNNIMKKKYVLAVVISIVVLVATAVVIAPGLLPNPFMKKSEKQPLTISGVVWVGYAPIYLAEENGFFRDEGIEVRFLNIEDMGEAKYALKMGKVDGQFTTLDTLPLYSDENIPNTMVLVVDHSAGADGIVATSDSKSVGDLRGKTIAVQKGFISYFFLLHLLDKEGMTSEDVEILDMTAGEAGAAFVAGRVDAAVTWEPWLSRASERPNGYILISSRSTPKLISDVIVFSPDVVETRREDVKAFMRAWLKAVDYWREHEEESDRIMADAYGLSPAEFEEMVSGLEWPDKAANLEFFGDVEDTGKVHEVLLSSEKVYAQEGLIKGNTRAEKNVDASLLREL